MQAEVTHGTWVFWPSQSNASMFKQLYLPKSISVLASENVNSYIYPVSIHEYIYIKFLTCTCEVGDPILSQNIDRTFVIPKAKQRKQMRKTTCRFFKNYGIICFGFMCKQKSHMAHEYAGDDSRARRISWTGTAMPTQSTKYLTKIVSYAVDALIISALHSAHCSQ